jgi:hypothetical protein
LRVNKDDNELKIETKKNIMLTPKSIAMIEANILELTLTSDKKESSLKLSPNKDSTLIDNYSDL